jgi:transposase
MKTKGLKASMEAAPQNGTPTGRLGSVTSPAGRIATVARPTPRPDPEVPEKPGRRRFTAEDKLRILREADACEEAGRLGALLGREGLYSAHLTDWRRQRELGTLAALAPKRRGRPGRHPLVRRVAELERENAHLTRRLQQAETIIEVQKKCPRCWGSP